MGPALPTPLPFTFAILERANSSSVPSLHSFNVTTTIIDPKKWPLEREMVIAVVISILFTAILTGLIICLCYICCQKLMARKKARKRLSLAEMLNESHVPISANQKRPEPAIPMTVVSPRNFSDDEELERQSAPFRPFLTLRSKSLRTYNHFSERIHRKTTPRGSAETVCNTVPTCPLRSSRLPFSTTSPSIKVTRKATPPGRPEEDGLREQLDLCRSYGIDTRKIVLQKSFRRREKSEMSQRTIKKPVSRSKSLTVRSNNPINPLST